MEVIKFDDGDKNWQWAVVEISEIGDEKWDEDIRNNGVQITVTMNGKEVKFSKLIQRLMESYEDMVSQRAKEILKEKACNIIGKLEQIEQLTEELFDK